MNDESTPLILKSTHRSSTKTWFSILVLCCLTAGSISLFSLYTQPLRTSLGLTQYQINTIAITAELGMYFPVPLIGYLGDKYGQSRNAWLSSILFCPAYLYAARTYSEAPNDWSVVKLSACFGLIGSATSSLYLSCLSSCARILPDSTGFAISAPVAAFGISSLWESQLLPKLFGEDKQGSLKINHMFIFFAFLYLFVGIIAGIAIHFSQADSISSHGNHTILDEEGQILENADPVIITDGSRLTQKERLILFLLNHETWILLIAFVLLSGPLEMYLNNIGGILSTELLDKATSAHVSAFSVSSTIARLTMGIGSDWMRPILSTATIITFIAFISGISFIFMATGNFLYEKAALITSLSPTIVAGFTYGSIFTLYPTMVAKVWGVESFGTNWGIFTAAPAVGSVIYSLIFAAVYEEHGDDKGICIGNLCYRATFMLTGGGFFIASILVLTLWNYRWKRGGIEL